jgi:FlaA1/EpsC-like NDP-sugar epimerase
MKGKISGKYLYFADAVVICFSTFLALTIDVNFRPGMLKMANFLMIPGLLVLVGICCCYLFGLYHKVWLYAGSGELVDLAKTASVICAAYFAIIITWGPGKVNGEQLVMMWGITWLGLTGARFSRPIYRKLLRPKVKSGKRVLIMGAGGAGSFVSRSMRDNQMAYRPVGFVDDDPERRGMTVSGLPVLGTREDIPQLVKKYAVEEIIIAIPSASSEVIRKIVDISKGTPAKIRIVPGIRKILEEEWSLGDIRDIQVEDLLHREPVETDLSFAAEYLKGKRVLVTGAGGSIGSELCRQAARFLPQQLILLGHGENSIYDIFNELRDCYPRLLLEPVIADIQDKNKMEVLFRSHAPQVVFHAAAHKHVPFMELHPEEAWKNNVLGTKNVAEASLQAGTEVFIFISTDKAVNPASILGATKRIAEMMAQEMNLLSKTKFAVVRFGNVLGSRGSVVPLFKKQIAAGGPVTITDPDMVRFFMTIPEAVQLVIQAGALARGGEIFVLDMGLPVKILDLAQDLISLSGLEPGRDIEIAVVGSRPGEKLIEELLTEEEKRMAVKRKGLIIVPPLCSERGEDNRWDQISSCSPKNHRETIDLIKRYLPEFRNTVDDTAKNY